MVWYLLIICLILEIFLLASLKVSNMNDEKLSKLDVINNRKLITKWLWIDRILLSLIFLNLAFIIYKTNSHSTIFQFVILILMILFLVFGYPFRVSLGMIKRDQIRYDIKRKRLEDIETEKKKLQAESWNIELKKKKELEEKKYAQFDKIINCPLCHGFGEHMIVERVEWTGNGRTRYSRSVWHNPNEWSLSIDEGDKDSWIRNSRKEKCAACDGQGFAYAYFESRNYSCYKCQGTGIVRDESFIKQDIGTEKKITETKCDLCHGSGNSTAEIVHVKTLNKFLLGDFYEDDFERIKQLQDNSWLFEVVIDDSNRSFYNKNKPREQS